MSDTSKRLRSNYLSFFEVIAQSIGTVAPSAVPGFMLPVIFGLAGNGTWFVIAFVGAGVVFLGLQIRVFACRVASPGALYVYAAESLGPIAGMLGGWSDITAYFFGGAAALAGVGSIFIVLLQQFINVEDALGLRVAVLAGITGLAGWLAYRDIKISTRTTFFIEFVTIALILFIVGLHFVHKVHLSDPAQLKLQGFTTTQFRAALVLAFFAFPGFETASALGAETKKPLIAIPRAILISTLVLAGFFLITTYGLVDAFHAITPGLDKQDAPLTVLAKAMGYDHLGVVLAAGVCSSIFAGFLGCINACSRVLYTLASRGLFHRQARRVHRHNATPHVAIVLVGGLALALALVLTMAGLSLMDIFAYLGTLCSFGFLLSYILVSIGAPVYLKRHGALRPIHIVTAAIAIAILIVPIIGSLYPVPEWPLNILPYIFIGLLALGSGYYLYVYKTDPQRLKSVENELVRN